LRAVSTATDGPATANSLRGSEFRRLMAEGRTWLWIGGPAVALGIFTLTRNPANAWVGPLFVLVVGLGAVFWIADRNAANHFWELYAETRGLELGGRENLTGPTPLFQWGFDRYATRTLSGRIAPGLVGMLALSTYEDTVIGPTGKPETKYYGFTIATCEVPECAPNIPELYGRPKHGLRSLQRPADMFGAEKQRVTLESAALEEHYEIFVGLGQDEVWTRRLFSPSFVVWLAESAPKKLSFELVDGTLVTYVLGYREDAGTLDAIAAATGTITQRLLEESAQTS
jgi:hypothetical protein